MQLFAAAVIVWALVFGWLMAVRGVSGWLAGRQIRRRLHKLCQ